MINLMVRGDNKRIVARAAAGVEWTVGFPDLRSTEFPMLWALTPYGDAVFNQRQIPLLLTGLDRLPAACGGEWVRQARELCQLVERGTHLYLWFVGD
ncbi:hypothetical protein [Streptomyces sp. ADI98-10]|uniref:hypothetical protein n=1 Tax=Streptomyces sp. ADI98-10 TaxID=1522763 RepID=UPI0019CFEFB3|nr:hypothetical protein [Streptomyces sp. ADI98-10]